jgi:hypothetical protein
LCRIAATWVFTVPSLMNRSRPISSFGPAPGDERQDLLSDDGSVTVGAAVLLEAPDAEQAGEVLPTDRYVGVEVHRWRFGGRPEQER